MARNAPKGPTPVDSIVHEAKRTNIPTADATEFHESPALAEIRRARYARDESLDPQLVWRDKYPATAEMDVHDDELETDAPPIYIQEKIDPRVLIENLRRTAARQEDEPELTLFESFDGLNELDQVDYYRHDANWSNRMILGDSLQVMASLAEREKMRGKVQMVYVDPPYGIKFNSNWQVSTKSRDVSDGRLADAAREVEQIKAFRDTWQRGIHTYLTYLRDRLLVARDLLTDSGSCFVQIGDENVHLVRCLMDEVFGASNFFSQITFLKTSSSTSEFGGTADMVLWYAKDRGQVKYRPLFFQKSTGGPGGSGYTRVELPDGTRRPLTRREVADNSLLPEGSRIFAGDNLTSQSMGRDKGEGAASWFKVSIGGRDYDPGAKARWKTNEEGMRRLLVAGRVLQTAGRNLAYLRYLDDFPAVPMANVWTDTLGQNQFGGDKMYVVQTALPVTQRCLLMSTDPGDLVVDPTCGSGTTAYLAEQWGRRWITIDTSRVALALARQRMMTSRHPWYLLSDSADGYAKEQLLTVNPLPRQQFRGDIRQGFVYDRVQHVTLKSIANNPDIQEGMTRAEIDAAVKRHADFELLYDKPFEDPKKVRVAGPFTVESLSPHRALAGTGKEEPHSETLAATHAGAPSFEQSILDNLVKAGIQNGTKAERIKFAAVESYAGSYLQAIAEQVLTGDGAAPSRIAISIGPQYGTVSASYVKNAAKEALRAEGVDLLCVLGFAFDPNVTNVTDSDRFAEEAADRGFGQVEGARQLGRLPVLMVRMNADLLMGEALKKSGAGNLFTVFGEPDIEVTSTSDGYVVDLRGVDVYDPTTGEVRSDDSSRIALWMIDTDYNGESFFVRHCYFTGGNDPYKRLKRSLKADIDEDAWASLYQTTSRPFPAPTEGNRIAVKVINDYGDEVMKVFEV